MKQTEERKREHILVSLQENVSGHRRYWDEVVLVHHALPEVNEEEIDLSTRLFGKKMGAPLVLSGMTGGYREAKKINERLASAAEVFQVGMGVGSQRAALENASLRDTYSVIKKYDLPLKIANIGASQMVLWNKQQILRNAAKIVDMIDADVLAVCLNFLQEAVQPEGEAHAKGCLKMIDMLSREFNRPILIKESGAGISGRVAAQLMKTRIAGIDVGGAGGTSFSAVEYYRAKMRRDSYNMREGQTFWDWGIPTPTCVLEVRRVTKGRIPIIATGGIRTGLDAAKAVALGADAAGVAHAMLKPAMQGKQAVRLELEMILRELRTAMFLVGADCVKKLGTVDVRYGSAT